MFKQQITQRQDGRQATLPVPPPKPPQERVRLGLHESDPVTGDEDALSTLFYEYYRGYTIYSTERGECCIHGAGRQGCLRLEGQYVSFPDIEEAKALIKYFRANGYTAADSMERAVPQGVYIWLNRQEQQRLPSSSRPMQQVSLRGGDYRLFPSRKEDIERDRASTYQEDEP